MLIIRFVFLLISLLLFSDIVYAANLINNGNSTVTDKIGLVWQQGEEGGKKTWEEAISYCESLSLAESNDWRLPNKKELISLVDYTRYNPSLDKNFFPGVYSSPYWTSTTDTAKVSSACYVDFNNGLLFCINKGDSYNVRCVKG